MSPGERHEPDARTPHSSRSPFCRPCRSSSRTGPSMTGPSGAARTATASRPKRGLLKDWPAGGPPLAWKATGAGEGYSSFATSAAGSTRSARAAAPSTSIAFDAATRQAALGVAHGRRFSNDRGDGPRATPTIEGDRVYAFGASGDLSVLDAASGKVFWTRQRARASSAGRTSSGASANRRWS